MQARRTADGLSRLADDTTRARRAPAKGRAAGSPTATRRRTTAASTR